MLFPVAANELFGWCLSDVVCFWSCLSLYTGLCREILGWWKWATRRGQGQFRHFFLLTKILSSVWAPGYAAQCVSSAACRSTVLPITAWVNAGTTSWLPFLSTRALCGAYLKVCLLLTDYSQVILFCFSVLHLIFLFFREMIVQDGLPWKSNKVLGVGRSFSLCQSCLHQVSNQVRLFFSSGSCLQLCRKICRYLTWIIISAHPAWLKRLHLCSCAVIERFKKLIYSCMQAAGCENKTGDRLLQKQGTWMIQLISC